MAATETKGFFSKKNAGLLIFVGAALLVAILLGVFVSPWASSSPDGLEKVAEDKGFIEKAEGEKPAWTHSPMKDYAFPGVKNQRASTGISGLVGVLITAAAAVAVTLLACGLGMLLSIRNGTKEAPLNET